MTDYRDRTNPNIILTSPDGDTYTAFWISNPRSFDKSLGIFKKPFIQGAEVQDLDRGVVFYTLVIYFEGGDNDLTAENFFQSCYQRGPWSVNHPTKGLLSLQLIRAEEIIDPVETGNITRLNTEWIEPRVPEVERSLQNISTDVNTSINAINATALTQANVTAAQDNAAQTESIFSAATRVVNSVRDRIRSIYERVDSINNRILAVQRGIQETIQAPVIDILSLGGQIQTLIQLPGRAVQDINDRVSTYTDMINDMIGIEPDTVDLTGRNTLVVKELALTAAIGTLGTIATDNDISTRQQSIDLINSIGGLFSNIVNGLDADQETFKNSDIDIQYFSQSSSYADAYRLISLSNEYLLRLLFDLRTEKRFRLRNARSPIEITISEYGSLGENDTNFDLFIDSNGLKGNDIILLPSNREVVVYV